MLQEIYIWLQANAAITQAIAAVAAIPVAFIAAYWSAGRNARQAFELSEKRERRKLEGQISLVRLLLGLEIQSNFDELRRFRNNFMLGVGHERKPDEQEDERTTNTERPGWFNPQQRFIALYLPDLSYRFWHGQQLSSLLPVALTRIEIRRVNLIYSNFDRLLKIRTRFGETMSRGDEAAFQRPAEGALREDSLSLSPNELKDLLNEFETILRDVLDIGNPLKDAIEEKKGEKYISSGESADSRGRLTP